MKWLAAAPAIVRGLFLLVRGVRKCREKRRPKMDAEQRRGADALARERLARVTKSFAEPPRARKETLN